jgi:hypothetical protein
VTEDPAGQLLEEALRDLLKKYASTKKSRLVKYEISKSLGT